MSSNSDFEGNRVVIERLFRGVDNNLMTPEQIRLGLRDHGIILSEAEFNKMLCDLVASNFLSAKESFFSFKYTN